MNTKKLLKNIDENKRDIAEAYIKELDFIEIELTSLKNDIRRNGLIEPFINGSQVFNRERPQAILYLKLLSKYKSLLKSICDILGEKHAASELDNFLSE